MAKDVNELLGVSMDRIREMEDVDTVVGTPITVGAVTLIPVSRVTYGFAGGGTDLPSKSERQLFGGGSGAGISVTPIAFLVVNDGRVSVMPLLSQPDSQDKLVSMIPDVVNKVSDLIQSHTGSKEK